jgi:hypothetical protein
MKTPLLFALLLLPFGGCAMLEDPNSAVSQLGTQALSIGLSKVTGRSVSANDVEGAAALLRSLSGAKKPTTQEIKVAVASGTTNPAKAESYASQLASLVSWAMAQGVPKDKALEITAAKQNEAAAISKAP